MTRSPSFAGDKPLRILFLAPQPFFEVRGTPLAVRAMVETLRDLGHSIDLLTYPQGSHVLVDPVRHLRSLRLPVGTVTPGPSLAKVALDVPFMAEAYARLLAGSYDVVHAVEEASLFIAPLCGTRGVALVADIDSSMPDQIRESGFPLPGPLLRALEALETKAFRSARAVITVCRTLSERVLERAPDAHVFQIEDPILDCPAPLPPEVADLRQRLRVPAGPVLVYTGNLESYQGVEMLVQAMVDLPDHSLIVVGGRTREIEGLRLRAQAMEVGARCFFPGPCPPERLGLYLEMADVLVSPRLRGTNTPFKIYTYLATGKPTIATRIPAHTQLLDDTRAVLAEPTSKALAAAARSIRNEPEIAAARAHASRDWVRREFSRDRYREKVRTAYASVDKRVDH